MSAFPLEVAARVNAAVTLQLAANVLERDAQRRKDSCRVRGLEWACCAPDGRSPCESRREYDEMLRLAGELRAIAGALT